MAAAKSVDGLPRIEIALGMLLLCFVANFGVARATCAPGAPPAYEDIDRILLVRCQATNSYPCFRSLLVIKNGQIKSGDLNAIKGIGLRGTYALLSTGGTWEICFYPA